MGFYGNITNTARTQFQFDKIYPNRVAMERARTTDNIYLGRHVLIEYDTLGLDGYIEVQVKNNKLYYNPKGSTSFITELKLGDVEIGDIVYETYSFNGTEAHTFYKITGEDKDSKVLQYSSVISDNGNPYVANYNIDIMAYGAGRGYDSTVWQKVYSGEQEKYVMIAELNTVVPTFDVSADAPTMSPIVPHFDTRSTDVYYKLHWQAPWGFRLAAADSENQSDLKTTWVRHKYDKDSGTTITEYYYPDKDEWKINQPINDNINAAIYFNAAGFEEDIPSYVEGVNNEIKMTLGQSGNEYNKHDGSVDVEVKDDIQELTINLPGVGNMMSKAWDIIHGQNRDDARTDENSSLQGRLNSFDAFYNNQIPVKRAADGTIVGSKINGATPYDASTDLLTLPEGADGTVTGFAGDDAWIKTNIDTSMLKAGDKDSDDNQIDNSGISIHHTFHATTNSTSTVDKNEGTVSFGENYKENHIRSSNNSHNYDDKLDLYVPYVDAKGHVVGHNIETVTLPYGYKYIATNALNEQDTVHEAFKDESTLTKSFSATSTQSHLQINAGNKWIGVYMERTTDDNNQTVDSITLDHMLVTIDDEDSEGTDLNSPINDTINIPDWSCDKAGHIISKKNHEYVLPYGFKTIKTNGRATDLVDYSTNPITDDIVADNTQDTLQINSGDKWIRIDTNKNNDSLTISHYNPIEPGSNVNVASPKPQAPAFGESFTIASHYFDEKGHRVASTSKNLEYKVTIPSPSLVNGTGNIVTGLTLDEAKGEITETKDNIVNLKLTGWAYKGYTGDITDEDTLHKALERLQARIAAREAAAVIECETRYNADKTLQENIDAEEAARKSEDAGLLANLNAEITRATEAEQNLNSRIDNLIGGEALNDAFDTLKEVSDWLAANDSGADKVIDDIAILKGSDTTEGSVANSIAQAITAEETNRNTAIDNKINELNVSDAPVDGQYVSGVSEANGVISVSRANLPTYTLISGSTNGTVAFNGTNVAVNGLKSAAYREEVYFVSKAQYDLDMSTKDAQINGLNGEAKRLTNEVKQLTDEVNSLRDLIQSLSERVTGLENQNSTTEE